MGVVFFGLDGAGEKLMKVGKVENGEIVEDPDNELKRILNDKPLQDGYLASKFNNRLLSAELTSDAKDKESGRTYVEFDSNIPDGVEVKESEYGAYYYKDQEQKSDSISIKVVDINKDRVYIDDPSQAPEGVEVHEGDRDPDALYYIPEGETDEGQSRLGEMPGEYEEFEGYDLFVPANPPEEPNDLEVGNHVYFDQWNSVAGKITEIREPFSESSDSWSIKLQDYDGKDQSVFLSPDRFEDTFKGYITGEVEPGSAQERGESHQDTLPETDPTVDTVSDWTNENFTEDQIESTTFALGRAYGEWMETLVSRGVDGETVIDGIKHAREEIDIDEDDDDDKMEKALKRGISTAFGQKTKKYIDGHENPTSKFARSCEDFTREAHNNFEEKYPEDSEIVNRVLDDVTTWIRTEETAGFWQSASDRSDNETKGRYGDPFEVDISDEQRAAIDQYIEYTQELSREIFGDTVQVYRGMSDEDGKRKEIIDDGKGIEIEHQSIESWTTDVMTAAKFGDGGIIMMDEVPVEAIMASYLTNNGMTDTQSELGLAMGETTKYDPGDGIIKTPEDIGSLLDIAFENIDMDEEKSKDEIKYVSIKVQDADAFWMDEMRDENT